MNGKKLSPRGSREGLPPCKPKMKIGFGIIIFVLLVFGVGTSLSAKDTTIRLFLNLSTGNASAFTYGGGVDIKVFKFISVKPSMDMTSIGGRIIFLDGVLRPNASGRVKPYLTVGYLDYYFKGNNRHDSDAVKSFTFGGGLDFYTKKGKCTASLGVRIARTDDISFPIFYLNLVLIGF